MKAGLRRHANTHLPYGSDPIPGIGTLVEGPAIWGAIQRDGSSSMTITNGALNATTTLIQHNVILDESGVTCDIVSTPSRIVIETAGLYLVELILADVAGGTGDYGLCVGRGLNTTGAIWAPVNAVRRVLTDPAVLNGISIESLDVGDYVTQVVGQNSGTNKTFNYLASLTVARYTGPVTQELGTIDGGAP